MPIVKHQYEFTEVFPRWISLNLVNHGKMQKWYNYHSYYLSGNGYIPSKVHFLYYFWVGFYCHWPHIIDTYPDIVITTFQPWGINSNHPTFGLWHDSVTSAKAIKVKLNWYLHKRLIFLKFLLGECCHSR